VNVVDSSGWIEFALDGPNAEVFQPPLLDTRHLVVPSISIFEVYRFVLRQRGRDEALTLAASMRQGRVVDLDAGLAVEAAELAVSLRLPMADAIIYAVARAHEATLWTQDTDFCDLDGVHFVAARGTR
jgi:predicted nucleic acid-binding protein